MIEISKISKSINISFFQEKKNPPILNINVYIEHKCLRKYILKVLAKDIRPIQGFVCAWKAIG